MGGPSCQWVKPTKPWVKVSPFGKPGTLILYHTLSGDDIIEDICEIALGNMDWRIEGSDRNVLILEPRNAKA